MGIHVSASVGVWKKSLPQEQRGTLAGLRLKTCPNCQYVSCRSFPEGQQARAANPVPLGKDIRTLEGAYIDRLMRIRFGPPYSRHKKLRGYTLKKA